MMDPAQDIVDELAPVDGWWKTSTEETLLEVARGMLSFGITEEAVKDQLALVVGAMSEEYGE